MLQEEDRVLGVGTVALQKPALIAVVVCTALCVFFINTGILSLLYLAPLGYAVLASGSIWIPFFAAASANALVSIITSFFAPESSGSLAFQIFYFTALFLCFAWVMGGAGLHRIRTAYRLVLASAAGAAAFLLFIAGNRRDSSFNAMLLGMAEMFSSLVSSSEADAVRQSALRQMFTPENIVQMTQNILLRGGALFSILLMFFINRHAALIAARLINKQKRERGLVEFFAPSNTIWALSGSLAMILLARLLKMDLLDIIAWNVFVVCAILFLAQGAGILGFFISRRTGAFRLLVNIMIIVVIISPGLNTLAVAALLLLGVAENWVPFRSPKLEAPTPGL